MAKKKKVNIKGTATSQRPGKGTPKVEELFTYKADDGKEYKLTLKQKLFCEYYLEFNGNGTEATIEAGYDCSYKNGTGTNRNLAKSIAVENLLKPAIYNYINSMLTAEGFNDHNVTKQHVFLLNQQADLSAKKGAVDMYYKIGGKYAPERVDIRGFLSEFDEVDNSSLSKTASIKHEKK